MIRFFRLVLAGMLLAMVGLVSAVTTMHFAIHGAEVKVPDLQGMSIPDAVRTVASLGLNLSIDNKYYSSDVPAGRVSAQSPPPGTIVRREWRMRVTESLGPQRVKIPDLVGEPERVAAIEVRRAGLELEEMVQMPYPGAQPGVVIAQNPQKGAAGAERPSISLLVSAPTAAPSPAFVMPQLVGMPFSTAAGLIAQAGLKLGPGENEGDIGAILTPGAAPEANANQPAAGTITSQSPPSGSRVDSSSVIELTVAP